MKILFAGGGTLGPVTPLIAVLRRMKERDPKLKAIWVGTPHGPEKEVVAAEKVPFFAMPVAKLPRYPSLEALMFPWRYFKAHQVAKELIEKEKPDLIVSVGGYMCVPLIREAASRGIPCAIHQLDAEPGIANRMVAKKCQMVTTSFAYPKPPFSGVDSEQLPTPCRFADIRPARHTSDRLKIFVLGGGTGATGLNQLVLSALPELISLADIVHLTGKGKAQEAPQAAGYRQAEFFNEQQMLEAYQNADIVISRAGLGTLSELAALQKATILVPLPGSQQERNAEAIQDDVFRVDQEGPQAKQKLLQAIKSLEDNELRKDLGKRLHQSLPTDDGGELAERWLTLVKGKKV